MKIFFFTWLVLSHKFDKLNLRDLVIVVFIHSVKESVDRMNLQRNGIVRVSGKRT